MKIKYLSFTKYLLCCVLIGNSHVVNAEASASAAGLARLKITNITNTTSSGDLSNLSITGSSEDLSGFFEDAEFSTIGGESNSITQPSPINLGVDSVFLQLSSAESNTLLSSNTSALNFTEGVFELINHSLSDTFEVAFTLDYTITVEATVTDLLLEEALSFAEILLINDIFSEGGGESFFNEFLAKSTSSIVGDVESLSDSFDFIVTVAPSSDETFALDIGVVTFTTAVPEPSIIILFSIGLCLITWQQKQGYSNESPVTYK